MLSHRFTLFARVHNFISLNGRICLFFSLSFLRIRFYHDGKWKINWKLRFENRFRCFSHRNGKLLIFFFFSFWYVALDVCYDSFFSTNKQREMSGKYVSLHTRTICCFSKWRQKNFIPKWQTQTVQLRQRSNDNWTK